MYSVVYPESNFGELSGKVPEWFRNQILVDFPEWFRKRSMYHLRISWCNLMRIRFPVALSAKIFDTLSIVLSSYFGGPCKCLKEYVGFSACRTPGVSGKCTYAFRRQLRDRVNICNRRYNLALGYGVDRILSCGGW